MQAVCQILVCGEAALGAPPQTPSFADAPARAIKRYAPMTGTLRVAPLADGWVYLILLVADRAASGWMKYKELPRAGKARSGATKLTEHGKDDVVRHPHAARLRAVLDMIRENSAALGRNIGITRAYREAAKGRIISHAHGDNTGTDHREKRGVAGQHTKIAFGAGNLNAAHIVIHHHASGGNDL